MLYIYTNFEMSFTKYRPVDSAIAYNELINDPLHDLTD